MKANRPVTIDDRKKLIAIAATCIQQTEAGNFSKLFEKDNEFSELKEKYGKCWLNSVLSHLEFISYICEIPAAIS